MMKLKKKHNIPLALFTLALTLTLLSFYNYTTQKNLLLHQMKSDSMDIVSSIMASIDRFHEIKSTMNLQKLINDISLDLEIFEFRYIEPNGTISNSMFKNEIGQYYQRTSFKESLLNQEKVGKFFFEERDYVPVMAIYYPVNVNDKLVGYIDLSIDVSEYEVVTKGKTEFALLRRQVDINNLLTAINGSIRNSIEIFETVDIYNFLSTYVEAAENIVQVSVINNHGKILVSNNLDNVGTILDFNNINKPQLIEINNSLVYRILIKGKDITSINNDGLLLLIDASPYKDNEQKLLWTAAATSGAAILFALFVAYTIFRFTVEQSREEKERLEHMVKERTNEIEQLSKTDALTGLWNRGYLDEVLELEFKQARRYKHDLTLLLIDLDHFKLVNDNYGHLAGDEVLRQTSQRILNSIRETDFVGRYGGEEIVVILPETNIDHAKMISEKIRANIAVEPVTLNDQVIKVTASIGVSYLREKTEAIESLFHEADSALYQSKEGGRNQVTVFWHEQASI